MITKILASQRYSRDYGWLKTNWLFSFSDYNDPKNIEFGALRVFNDDIAMPGGGFPNHPHEGWEIVTIVLSGELTHKDSMGNEEIIRAHDVQRISAGEGIVHSEYNNATEPVHLYQIWFYANKKTHADYEQKKINFKKEGLTPIDIRLHADAKISFLKLKSKKEYEYKLPKKKGLFAYITDGNVLINKDMYETGDQARIIDEKNVSFSAIKDCFLILIEVVL